MDSVMPAAPIASALLMVSLFLHQYGWHNNSFCRRLFEERNFNLSRIRMTSALRNTV